MAAETNHRAFISYVAPKRLYGLCWGTKASEFRLAASTFIPGEYVNKLQILLPSPNNSELMSAFEIEHPYPPTKVMWSPQSFGNSVEYLATTADYLRIWTVTDSSLERHATISTKRNQETCAPLTSLDWNELEPTILGTTSIDTTCTIWDLNNVATPKHQIIAHDDEVYDISFSRNNPSLFVSVGGDGSLRSFDLRALESSQIMYESQELKPLLRVAWNPHDDRYLATIIAGKPSVVIIDSRSAARPVVELNQHSGSVNSISWSPHSKFHICSAAEDRTAIVYDIANIAGIDGVATGMNARHANRVTSSVFFRSQTPINQVSWSPNQDNCIALCDEEAAHVVQL